jgi:hypothetical protein
MVSDLSEEDRKNLVRLLRHCTDNLMGQQPSGDHQYKETGS